MYQIFDKIKILEKQPHDEKDGGEMNIMRQKALQCDADINLLHNICTVKNNQRFQYQQVIASIEQAIQGTTGGGIVDVESVLMKAMEMQKNVLTNSFKTIKDVSELTEKKPSDLERITGQDLTTSENLETRYQALAERMKQL
jgi:hypothetical protein